MILEESHLYHIYNQGNNRQKIFFSHDNYLFFLKKIKLHILRTYTRAINKQENRSGSRFKTHTKAECINEINGITPTFCNTYNEAEITRPISENEYPQICFNYIHANPLNAKLVQKSEDWEFSSYRDYCGLRNGKLINRIRTRSFGLQLDSGSR